MSSTHADQDQQAGAAEELERPASRQVEADELADEHRQNEDDGQEDRPGEGQPASS